MIGRNVIRDRTEELRRLCYNREQTYGCQRGESGMDGEFEVRR